jgi:hypothetical protein
VTARRVVPAVALCAVLLAACTATVPVTPGTPPPPATAAPGTAQGTPGPPARPHCGTERWPVKTGTDADAAKVDLHVVQPATIGWLASLPASGFLPQSARIPPAEMTVYQVTATLREYKLEADSDVHLVLADDHGNTMIAELPAPACATGSPFLPGITTARAQFDARFHPTDTWQHAGVTVTVEGVGFFDDPHGQTGMARPNAIELHPVLDIQFGGAHG